VNRKRFGPAWPGTLNSPTVTVRRHAGPRRFEGVGGTHRPRVLRPGRPPRTVNLMLAASLSANETVVPTAVPTLPPCEAASNVGEPST
jgi:hypothetical protein